MRITDMKLRGKLAYRTLARLLAVCALAFIVWWLSSRPVLFRSRFMATAEDRLCRDYAGEEVRSAVLNPFRSRSPERVADAFLRAVSNARCLPGWNERTCTYVIQHPVPAQSWRVADRYDSDEYVMLIYWLNVRTPGKREVRGCWPFSVQLHRTGVTWRVSSFGLGSIRAAKVIE